MGEMREMSSFRDIDNACYGVKLLFLVFNTIFVLLFEYILLYLTIMLTKWNLRQPAMNLHILRGHIWASSRQNLSSGFRQSEIQTSLLGYRDKLEN